MILKSLTNRVTKRLLILLLVTSTFPLILLIIPSLNFITQNLYNGVQLQLKQAAIDLGTDLEERLSLIHSEMDFLSKNTQLFPNDLTVLPKEHSLRKRLENWFKEFAVVKPNHQTLTLLNSTKFNLPALHKFDTNLLENGNSILITEQSGNSTSSIFILQKAHTKQRKGEILIGELNPKLLWQVEESLPNKNVIGCVLNLKLEPLICSSPFVASLNSIRNELLNKPEGKLRINLESRDYLMSYWSNFSNAHNYKPNWIIIMSIPSAVAIAPLHQFIFTFSLFLIIGIVIILYLGAKRIGKVMEPLDILKENTSSNSMQSLNQMLEIHSGDEFEEIAKSINTLHTRLDKQFNALETMSHIDRMILATLGIENIIETILFKMKSSINCEEICIFITGENNNYEGELYFNESKTLSGIHSKKIWLSDKELTLLSNNRSYFISENQNKSFSFFSNLPHHYQLNLLLPIYLENKLAACIILNYFNSPILNSEELKRAREMADRIAVALSNAVWEKKLYHQAHFDNLTGLPNRMLFQDRLKNALKRADRNKSQVALMFLDIDYFKSLNDSLGHSAGDEFLKETAQRIVNTIRKVDTVSRIGGDEFTIIIPDLAQADVTISKVSHIAKKILNVTSTTMEIDKQTVTLTSSIGVAIYPNDADKFSDLIKAADAALYYAKDKGKGNHQFYSLDIDAETKAHIQLEDNLKLALKNNEFKLYFQPRIDTLTQAICGAETLIRWHHSETHTISPKEFIPLIEENGLILSIGDWILKNACRICKKWHSLGYNNFKISVNLSPYQLRDSNIIQQVEAALRGSQLDSKFLELEITESALMKEPEKSINTLNILKQMGITVAIDDFGTGYSSLSYLKNFPVDTLKIDQSFIHKIHEDKSNAAIVSAILTLAQHLGLTVVAEGIEIQEEFDFLKVKYCQEVQGYLFNKPLSENDFENYLKYYIPQPNVPHKSNILPLKKI